MAGRPGRCEEVADVVEFLCSDRSSYINAQMIHINGGI
ncbi:MAG: SDR family oxidoreductase [Betaproteobacteria bacterium]|nr:SDR family oxidoreductase [Betaproteobacteria bacterium]